MRLIVARCSANYSGRLDTYLPEATRLIMIKADGTLMIWARQNLLPRLMAFEVIPHLRDFGTRRDTR